MSCHTRTTGEDWKFVTYLKQPLLLSKPPDYFKNKFLLPQYNVSINIGLYLLLCFDVENGRFHVI